MRALALAAALVAGCAGTPPPAERVYVSWNRVDDVQANCQKLSGRPELFRLRGCAKWNQEASGRVCAIYAPAPRDERDTQAFATLGHELLHCFDGRWHDQWGRMNDAERQAAAAASSRSQSSSQGSAAAD